MSEALTLLRDTSTFRGINTARVIPDSLFPDVFLVIGKKWAAIVYLNGYMGQKNFEEVDVFEATEKYGEYKKI